MSLIIIGCLIFVGHLVHACKEGHPIFILLKMNIKEVDLFLKITQFIVVEERFKVGSL